MMKKVAEMCKMHGVQVFVSMEKHMNLQKLMTKRARNKRSRHKRGSYLVEAALTLPVFILCVIALALVIRIIGICENLVKAMPFEGATTFVDAFTFALLIVILIVKPTGLFGEKTTDKV